VSSDQDHILDTVVLLYFLLVAQGDLLIHLLGGSLTVPLAVYDPEDRSLSDEALRHSELLSEMRQVVRHYEIAARSDQTAVESLQRVRRVDDLYDDDQLTVVTMSPPEALLAAQLQSRDRAADYGLRAPLGPGEAACVAIAWKRDRTIATDDDDALKVLGQLHGSRTYSYERIRKLLVRAADEKRITAAQANNLHAEMRDHGFWDAGTPFPTS
jgi:hypothetical protein